MILFVNILLLFLSIVLASFRNLLSKSISDHPFPDKSFFLLQAVIFFAGSVVLIPFGMTHVSTTTLMLALIYGGLLIMAQWCYTAALKSGNLSLCATVYSLGFILPTMSGMLFYEEDVTIVKILGVILVIPAIVFSKSPGGDIGNKKQGLGYMIPLVGAMLASGGLGIMQKVQSKSAYVEEKGAFVLISFIVAAAVSLLFGIFTKSDKKINKRPVFGAAGIGACFSICNLLNTHLASQFDSAIFYPTLNIGMILLSLALSIMIFKEKFTRRHVFVLAFAFSGMILVNLPV